MLLALRELKGLQELLVHLADLRDQPDHKVLLGRQPDSCRMEAYIIQA